jgi:putative DNA primase/helicase
LVFIGNHKPEITYLDEAIRRRIHMVPFTIQPCVVDKQLPDKLEAEAPGILAWAVKGCLHWQRVGLMAPSAVLNATEEYFEDEDAVGRFLEERCVRLPKETTSLDALFRAWGQWSHARGEHPGTVRRLGQLLQSHGFERTKDPNTRRAAMRGVTLIPDSLEELI